MCLCSCLFLLHVLKRNPWGQVHLPTGSAEELRFADEHSLDRVYLEPPFQNCVICCFSLLPAPKSALFSLVFLEVEFSGLSGDDRASSRLQRTVATNDILTHDQGSCGSSWTEFTPFGGRGHHFLHAFIY